MLKPHFIACLMLVSGVISACTETRQVIRPDKHGRCPGQCVEYECQESAPPLVDPCNGPWKCVPCSADAGR